MDRYRSRRVTRVQIEDPPPRYDIAADEAPEQRPPENGAGDLEGSPELRPSMSNAAEDPEPFMGVEAPRKASLHREYKRDYFGVPSKPYLMKILEKQGDRQVIFADKVLKLTGTGKMKQRILLITDFAIYIVDPEADTLKRRISLAAVDKICLSELSDNFFAIIIPTEYDLLMASTRKIEIVNVLVEEIKRRPDYGLEVDFSNSFEYRASADLLKQVQFEMVDGGVKTRILRN